MVHEKKSDSWEDADSAFWFIVEPRYAEYKGKFYF